MPVNQNPEQKARDHIDKQLTACGWLIQSMLKMVGVQTEGIFNELNDVLLG